MSTKAVAVTSQTPSLPSLWELPPQLTECERREFFRLVTERDGGGMPVSRKVFIPPSQAEERELSLIGLALENRLAPSDPEIVITALARLANHHKTDRTPQEWGILYEDYARDLAEFSSAHVVQAINEHRRTSKWFPKVSELRERCAELRSLDQIRLRRVKLSLTGKEAA